MIQKELVKIKKLEREVKTMRSFMVSLVGLDKEGEYQPEFVRNFLKSANERPSHIFSDEKSFLSELGSV